MPTPDIEKLDLSDSDPEDLFASPSRASKPKQKPNSKPSESTNAAPQRNGESKYDIEQARDAALRKELESVRSINEVIEGVVSSLEAAKGNMDVRRSLNLQISQLLTMVDRIAHSYISIYTAKYLDSDPITDRT
jgi:hypothetical protein